ncbi:MAG: xylulokinase [Clostridia bacterium]|nr:xylulokinase [Clostridia bacterium]
MDGYLIGIDLGTTGCRSAILNSELKILAEQYIEYSLINISDTEIEQDADLWWTLTKKVIKESIAKSKVDPLKIRGLSISSQGIAFVPVDENCNTLMNAISWLDARAKDETQEILENFDEDDMFNITGKRTSATYVLPKLLWIKNNKRDIYDKTYKFLMGHDFLIAKFTGNFVTDHTMASGTLMYDINKQDWSLPIIERFGLNKEKLPQIEWSGTNVGVVKPEVAQELGIANDVVVSLGGQDQKCAALGAGIKDNVATVSLGTATAITTKGKQPLLDKHMRIPCFSDLLKQRWVLEAVIGTAGVSLKWLRNTLFADKSYEELDEMVEQCGAKQSNLFFYPHLTGASTPYWKPDIRGFVYGISLATTPNEIVRSVFEGIAYQIKVNLDIMEELSGEVEEIRLFGGGAKGKVWCQIIADITGKKVVTLYTPETACVGAAILAMLGCGMIEDVEQIEEANVDDIFYPDKENQEVYAAKYQDYIDIQNRLLNC